MKRNEKVVVLRDDIKHMTSFFIFSLINLIKTDAHSFAIRKERVCVFFQRREKKRVD